MSLLTLSILAVIALVILGIAIYLNIFKPNYEGMMIVCYFISIIGLFVIGVIGFGIHATDHYEKMYVEKMKCDTVVYTKNNLYVEINGETLTYTSKEDYDYIKDTTTFCKVSYYNYYGTWKTSKFMLLRDCWKDVEFNKQIDSRK